MATITPLDPRKPAGVVPAPANASGGGDVIPMQPGKTYLIKVNNGAVGAITMDINDPVSGNGLIETDDASVGATSAKVFCITRPNFGKTPTADVALTYSAVTTVTVEVYGPLN